MHLPSSLRPAPHLQKGQDSPDTVRVGTGQADDVIRLPPVPLVVTPTGEPSEKERMDTELLKPLGLKLYCAAVACQCGPHYAALRSLLLSYFTIVKSGSYAVSTAFAPGTCCMLGRTQGLK